MTRHTWFSATSCRMSAEDTGFNATPIKKLRKEMKARKRARWFFSQRWLVYSLALLTFPFRKKEKAVQILAALSLPALFVTTSIA